MSWPPEMTANLEVKLSSNDADDTCEVALALTGVPEIFQDKYARLVPCLLLSRRLMRLPSPPHTLQVQ